MTDSRDRLSAPAGAAEFARELRIKDPLVGDGEGGQL